MIDETGQATAAFPWTLPAGCAQGCEVVFPITMRHIGNGDPPGILWSLNVAVLYDDVNNVPDLIPRDWPAVIERPNG